MKTSANKSTQHSTNGEILDIKILKLEALKMAHAELAGATVEIIIERAQKYLAFLIGNSSTKSK